MYNIAVIYLQFAWFGGAFFAGGTIRNASGDKKLYIFSPIPRKCIIEHDQNIHFCRILRKMYNLTDLTSPTGSRAFMRSRLPHVEPPAHPGARGKPSIHGTPPEHKERECRIRHKKLMRCSLFSFQTGSSDPNGCIDTGIYTS